MDRAATDVLDEAGALQGRVVSAAAGVRKTGAAGAAHGADQLYQDELKRQQNMKAALGGLGVVPESGADRRGRCPRPGARVDGG